ncbi:MAG: hypothetical protein IPK76_16085 [Lewinellaceae bacterium]|nr:hypothetical protein [Lewinellaceae bacterium]
MFFVPQIARVVGAGGGNRAAKPAVLFILLEFEVDRFFPLPVVDAAKYGLVRLFIIYLYLVDSVGGQVFGGEFGVVSKEFLPSTITFFTSSPCARTVPSRSTSTPGSFFQQILYYGVVFYLERPGVKLNRVLPDGYRVSCPF